MYVIGMMSGTSLDGVDLVYVKFNDGNSYEYQIMASTTYAYPEKWKENLKEAFHKKPHDLQELDELYGMYLGELVLKFVSKYSINKVDFIASHGHTIFHKPEEGYTLQIGCGNKISEATGFKVVYDFRSQDVALGGQGAPLVPIGDAYMFSGFDYCLNLGGFANISFDDDGIRKAFDICPVNIVMNHYMTTINKEFDDKGQLAKSGEINVELLKKLNDDEFYSLKHPKSLGFEFVMNNVIPLIDSFGLPLQDLLRTYIEHISFQIVNNIDGNSDTRILVTGGGAYNDFLMDEFRSKSNFQWLVPEKELIEYKEALIFALLGLLKVKGKVNCLKSVTGARKDHCSGRISE